MGSGLAFAPDTQPGEQIGVIGFDGNRAFLRSGHHSARWQQTVQEPARPSPPALARGSLRGKIPELTPALRGLVTDHHRFLLRMLLSQVDQVEGLIAAYAARIEGVAAPFAEAAGRLESVPGMGAKAAEVIVAEIGTDMTKFPTAGHLASWAGLCPGNDESAGKRRTGKTTKGSQ